MNIAKLPEQLKSDQDEKEKAALVWRPFKLRGLREERGDNIEAARLIFDKNQKRRDEARRIAVNIARLPDLLFR